MPEPTEQDWLDYREKLDQYASEVANYIAHFSENPQVPRPPKPPQFNGWLGEE